MVVRFEKFFIGFLYCYNNACIRKKRERKEKKEMTNKKRGELFHGTFYVQSHKERSSVSPLIIKCVY